MVKTVTLSAEIKFSVEENFLRSLKPTSLSAVLLSYDRCDTFISSYLIMVFHLIMVSDLRFDLNHLFGTSESQGWHTVRVRCEYDRLLR